MDGAWSPPPPPPSERKLYAEQQQFNEDRDLLGSDDYTDLP